MEPRAHRPQHFLYFLPLPHGQGSFRPAFFSERSIEGSFFGLGPSGFVMSGPRTFREGICTFPVTVDHG